MNTFESVLISFNSLQHDPNGTKEQLFCIPELRGPGVDLDKSSRPSFMNTIRLKVINSEL